MDESFRAYFDHGESLMKMAGNQAALREAARQFEHAGTIGDKWEHLRAVHMALICRRMAGDYHLVFAYFDDITQVLKHTTTKQSRGFLARVRRDVAMVPIEQIERGLGDRDQLIKVAQDLLDKSERTLKELGEIEEAAVTHGFNGRLESALGNYQAAAKIFADVDSVLRRANNPVYELNNLIHLLGSLVPITHPALIVRALRLTKQTGDTRRYRQIVLLTLAGGRLYRRASY